MLTNQADPDLAEIYDLANKILTFAEKEAGGPGPGVGSALTFALAEYMAKHLADGIDEVLSDCRTAAFERIPKYHAN
jgi:hypothetical protein